MKQGGDTKTIPAGRVEAVLLVSHSGQFPLTPITRIPCISTLQFNGQKQDNFLLIDRRFVEYQIPHSTIQSEHPYAIRSSCSSHDFVKRGSNPCHSIP